MYSVSPTATQSLGKINLAVTSPFVLLSVEYSILTSALYSLVVSS